MQGERSEDIFANDIFGESPVGAQELVNSHFFTLSCIAQSRSVIDSLSLKFMLAANCLAILLTDYVLARELLLCLISSRYLFVQGTKRGFLIKENAHRDNWDGPGGYYCTSSII